MTASYRLIHFTPDPFTGARFPLGAIVADGRGQVRVAKVKRLPSAICLGDRNLSVAVQRLHARLDGIASLDALPAVFGPYATLAAPQQVPAGVRDALAWVQQLLTPPSGSDRVTTPRGQQRGSLGFRFFETWRVAQHIRKTLRPTTDWSGWLGGYPGLQQVTHWVEGNSKVLLMEPVLPARRQFDQDVQDIAVKFWGYRYALDKVENGREGQLIAYLPAGGHPDQRAAAVETLGKRAHRVVDTLDEVTRDAFLGDIRRVGGEGDPQRQFGAEA